MSIVDVLLKNLPEDSVISDPLSLRTFECDGLAAYRQKPMVVVLPKTLAQIQKIVDICKQHQTPIVSRGAGTGLSGGALPIENAVVLGFSRMDKILSVDVENRTAVLQPGVRNLAISEAVAKHGLYYAPDPSSQIACTIGGNVAENSGGVHCLKYGLTVHNVLEVKILTIEGELLTLNHFDDLGLTALLNGSEGLLGMIVEIKIKLIPKPDCAKLVMAGFDSVDACADAVAAIITAGVIPAGLEMMDNLAIVAAEDFVQVGYPVDAKALLLCELDGAVGAVGEEMAKVMAVLKTHAASTVKVAKDEAERLALWQGRKSSFPAVGRLAPDYYCMDGTIPKYQLSYVLGKMQTYSEKYGLRVANVFHAGDGNLHPLILFDAAKAGQLESAEAFGADILKLCVEVGGTITGEHGVGIEKLDAMCSQFSDDELAQLHAIKAVFDEHNLLNPGKAVPTLHRCAELGAMHVHHGKTPFPELERF